MRFGYNDIRYSQDLGSGEGLPEDIDFIVTRFNASGWVLRGPGYGNKRDYGNGSIYLYKKDVTPQIASRLNLECTQDKTHSEKENDMEITIKLKITPWAIPGSIYFEQTTGVKQDGMNITKGIPLHEVESNILSELCDRFRADIFEAARKDDPKNG